MQQEQQSLLDEQARRQADQVEIEKLQRPNRAGAAKQEELEAQLAQREALRQEMETVRDPPGGGGRREPAPARRDG